MSVSNFLFSTFSLPAYFLEDMSWLERIIPPRKTTMTRTSRAENNENSFVFWPIPLNAAHAVSTPKTAISTIHMPVS
jgi:hypothetical protein